MKLKVARLIPATGAVALVLILLSGGPVNFLRAQSPPEDVSDKDLTPYQKALLNYKSGHYDDAHAAIDAAEKAKPGDPATEILKALILTEQGDFDGAKKTLESLNGNAALTSHLEIERTVAFGDLSLRKRSFDEATKFYESLLSNPKTDDPDIILKIVYSRIGAGDLVAAGKYASRLKPLDPNNPAYYFAKAALAQSTGDSGEADNDISTVGTMYGISVSNRYLKTYLELTAPPAKKAASPPAAPPAPETNTPAVPKTP